jgi:hypothetical protein
MPDKHSKMRSTAHSFGRGFRSYLPMLGWTTNRAPRHPRERLVPTYPHIVHPAAHDLLPASAVWNLQ